MATPTSARLAQVLDQADAMSARVFDAKSRCWLFVLLAAAVFLLGGAVTKIDLGDGEKLPTIIAPTTVFASQLEDAESVQRHHWIDPGKCDASKGGRSMSVTWDDYERHLEKGFWLFPVHSDKTPACAHGFKDAVQTLDEFKALCGGVLPWGYGIACGKSRLAVVDIDVKSGDGVGWHKRNLSKLPKTFRVNTPSGGWHQYYIVPEGVEIESGVLEQGAADLKSAGGYVVGPGSPGYDIPDGEECEIAPLSEDLRRFLDRCLRTRRVAIKAMSEDGLKASICTGENVHDCFLELSGRWRHKGMDPIEMTRIAELLAQRACAARPDRDLDTTIREFGRMMRGARGPAGEADEIMARAFGLGASSQDAPVQFHGLAGTTDLEVGDVAPSTGTNGPTEWPFDGTRSAAEAHQEKLAWPAPMNFKRLLDSPLRAVDWVADELLARGMVSMFAAPANLGKTRLLTSLAVAISCGKSGVLGLEKLKPGPVLLVLREETSALWDRRLRAVLEMHDIKEPAHDLVVVTRDAEMSKDLFLVSRGGREPIEPNEWIIQSIIKKAKEMKASMIGFDPFVELSRGLEENSATDMIELMSVFRTIAVETNAAVALMHHTVKKEGADDDMYLGRGSSAIMGAADIIWIGTQARPIGDNIDRALIERWRQNPEARRWVQWSAAKNREATRQDRHWYFIESHDIPVIDGDGEEGQQSIGVLMRRTHRAFRGAFADAVMVIAQTEVDRLREVVFDCLAREEFGAGKHTVRSIAMKLVEDDRWPLNHANDVARARIRGLFSRQEWIENEEHQLQAKVAPKLHNNKVTAIIIRSLVQGEDE